MGPSAMAPVEHANGALAHWKVEVASRQAKKRYTTAVENDNMSMHTNNTAAGRLGRTRVPGTRKGQGHALMAEGIGDAA